MGVSAPFSEMPRRATVTSLPSLPAAISCRSTRRWTSNVESAAPLFVTEDLVGGAELNETRSAFRIGVGVRMQLLGQLPEGLVYFLSGRCPRHRQALIGVPHPYAPTHHSWPTIAASQTPWKL